MSSHAYCLGPLTIAVEGAETDAVFCAVRDELNVLEAGDAEQADVLFRFVDGFSSPAHALHVGRWQLFEGGLVGRGGGYRFKIERPDDQFLVDVDATVGRRALADHYKRAWNWNFLAPWETTAKNFMYDLFDLVTGAAVVEQGASYLHASTCCRHDQALALIAWGGIGKTTSVLKLVTEDGWKYLSDDLGLIDNKGQVWRTPRRLQIYAYNVAGQPALFDRVMGGRGPVDRINWHWRKLRFGAKRVRRRMGAEELFGPDLVGDCAPLGRAIFLERADVAQMEWSELSIDEMAHRSATILVDELNTLTDVAVAAESHGIDVGIAPLDRLRQQSQQVLAKAFADVPLQLLRIPVAADPDGLAQALRREI